MAEAERILSQAIRKATDPQTGRLRDIRGNWQWVLRYNFGKDGEQLLAGPQDLPAIRKGDILVLRPTLEYATIVSSRAGLSRNMRATKRRAARTVYETIFAHTARRLRSSQQFKPFKIRVGFTRKYEAPGEVWPHGTAYISMRLR